VAEICERAAARAADRVVLLPAIPHGYDPHHMDFPGAITIGWDTFVRYCADVGRSLAHHGFRRMLFLNGHGSNQNLVETAARLDWSDGPLKLMPWWSSFSRSGVQGDATLGTAEKGQALLEAAVDECLAYVDELLAKPLPDAAGRLLEPSPTPSGVRRSPAPERTRLRNRPAITPAPGRRCGRPRRRSPGPGSGPAGRAPGASRQVTARRRRCGCRGRPGSGAPGAR
jgi:Creatinine amidohydrolase